MAVQATSWSLAHTPGKPCNAAAPDNGPNGRDHSPLRLSSGVIHRLLLEAVLTHSPPAGFGTPSGLPWHSVFTPILAPTKLFGMVILLCAGHRAIKDEGIHLDYATIFNIK